MSSTSRTRSPGRDREAAPELAARGAVGRGDLLGEDRAGAQLAAGLEREDHAAGRRAGDEVDVAVPSSSPVGRRPEPAQLARRGRVLEHLELLQVRVRVAAALEHEVALAQGAARAEQGLGARGDRAARGVVEGASEGGHRAGMSSREAAASRRRPRVTRSARPAASPSPRGTRPRPRPPPGTEQTGPAPTIASHTPRFASQTRIRRVSSSSARPGPRRAFADRRRLERVAGARPEVVDVPRQPVRARRTRASRRPAGRPGAGCARTPRA